MATKIRVAINGFGRIGRAVFKIALTKKNIDIVGINDVTDVKTLAHLLQYDSVFGTFDQEIKVKANALLIGKKRYPVFQQPNPAKLPWKKLRARVVLECTGRFTKAEEVVDHLKAGAKRVIVSAPVKGDAPTFIIGVNEEGLKDAPEVVSNASCTTNCISPVMEVLQRKFGIKKAMMTTVHSYTQDQRLHDSPHKDLRRARAAAQNIIPTTTGAALSTTEILPELKGVFDGLSLRVPTINVSISDMTVLLKRKVTREEVNRALINASKSPRYDGILGVTDKPLVSSDFVGDPRSSIVDLSLTNVVDGDLVKVVSWYDNEWGYSNRMVEMVQHLR